jgi:hypothetical protein
MSDLIQQKAFDFSSIDDTATRTRVIERDIRFDFTKQQVESGLIEMGRILIEQKADLQHGQWKEWLDSKDVSQRTAQSLMQINEKLSNAKHVSYLGIRVLQLLSQDSTPESARTEAIEQAENGKKLTVKEAKELVEAHRRIDILQTRLEAQKNKPASIQYRDKIPDDYEEIIERKNQLAVEKIELKAQVSQIVLERDSLVDEKGRLLSQIKKIKESQESEIDKKVNQKLKAMEDDFALKNKQLESVQNRIDYLHESMKSMDKTAGDMVASKKACDQIRGFLLEISIALRDLFEDHKLTSSSEKEMRHLCSEMEQGTSAFRGYLDGKELVQIKED